MYCLTEFFCELVDEDIISTTINLNSPGSVRVKLKQAFELLTKGKMPLVFLFLVITGGSGLGFEFPGIAGFIREYRTMDLEVQKEEIAVEKERMELYTQKIEYAQQYMELIKMAEENGVDIDNVLEQLDELDSLDDTLRYETNTCGESENEE